jgi:hypothetical protein
MCSTRHSVAQFGTEPCHCQTQPIQRLGLHGDFVLPCHLPIAPAGTCPRAGGLTAAQVVGGIDHHTVKPCGKARLRRPTAQLGGQGRANILRQILGIGATARHPPRKPMHAVIMARDQHRKSSAIPASGGSCKRFIGRIHQHHHG